MTYSEAQMLEAKKQSFDDGLEHARPSKVTENFINMTEKRLELMDFRMKGIEDNIKDIKASLEKSEDKFDTLLDKLDARYALKNTETTVNRVAWIVATSVILALLALILKN
jgi:archaellum component FlaC